MALLVMLVVVLVTEVVVLVTVVVEVVVYEVVVVLEVGVVVGLVVGLVVAVVVGVVRSHSANVPSWYASNAPFITATTSLHEFASTIRKPPTMHVSSAVTSPREYS